MLKGEKIFPEEELTHLDGHKGSKPVRIGNGAIDHIQLVSRLHVFHRKSWCHDIFRISMANCAVDRYSLMDTNLSRPLGWIVSISGKRCATASHFAAHFSHPEVWKTSGKLMVASCENQLMCQLPQVVRYMVVALLLLRRFCSSISRVLGLRFAICTFYHNTRWAMS